MVWIVGDRNFDLWELGADARGLAAGPKTQDAIVRNIEIIGEAVSKIQKLAPAFIEQHPRLPRARMRAMRNVVIHEYLLLDLAD